MKCTINDIALELGLSRNTVSKALRDHPDVSSRTRSIVKKKSLEMGYTIRDSSDVVIPEISNNPVGAILFLTRSHNYDSQFWPNVLKGIEFVLSKKRLQLVFANLTDEELSRGDLPTSILSSNIKGIIAVEVCYIQIWEKLLSLNIPLVTVDAPKDHLSILGKVDIIMMENKLNIYKLTEKLIKMGAKDFSFVGDLYSKNVGRGFQERFDALVFSLKNHDLLLNKTCSITHESSDIIINSKILGQYVSKMNKLPDVFFCGNDLTAIQLIYSLQSNGYKVPEDVKVIGFDNISSSENFSPSLTTIDTPKEYLGRVAAERIIERIAHPNIPCIYTEVSTKLILRESTNQDKK